MTKLLESGIFSEFVDDEYISEDMAFYTTCNICGEWLNFEPEIIRGSEGEIEKVTFVAGSCGEKFRLIPNGYIMKIEEKEGLV